MKNRDMPAAPVTRDNSWDAFLGGGTNYSYGLTKREDFTKAAMQGLLANEMSARAYTVMVAGEDADPGGFVNWIGELAAEHAEATLAALEA